LEHELIIGEESVVQGERVGVCKGGNYRVVQRLKTVNMCTRDHAFTFINLYYNTHTCTPVVKNKCILNVENFFIFLLNVPGNYVYTFTTQ